MSAGLREHDPPPEARTAGLAVDDATPDVAFQALSVSEAADSWEDEGDDAPKLPVDANAAWMAVAG